MRIALRVNESTCDLLTRVERIVGISTIFPTNSSCDNDDEDGSAPSRPATASYSFRIQGEGIPFVLNVLCPATYPDLLTPEFRGGYDGDGPARLHVI